MSKSYNEEHLKDVEFHVEDINQREGSSYQVLKAHSYILASASPIFQAMLFGPLALPLQPPQVIPIKETTPEAFTALLQYIYQWQLPHGSPAHLLEVCNLAHRYHLQTLQTACEDKLRSCEPMSGGLLSTCRALARHQHLDRAARIMRTVCRKMLVRNMTHMGVGLVRELVNSMESEDDLLCVKYMFNIV